MISQGDSKILPNGEVGVAIPYPAPPKNKDGFSEMGLKPLSIGYVYVSSESVNIALVYKMTTNRHL